MQITITIGTCTAPNRGISREVLLWSNFVADVSMILRSLYNSAYLTWQICFFVEKRSVSTPFDAYQRYILPLVLFGVMLIEVRVFHRLSAPCCSDPLLPDLEAPPVGYTNGQALYLDMFQHSRNEQ